jgi:hypothetical protein
MGLTGGSWTDPPIALRGVTRYGESLPFHVSPERKKRWRAAPALAAAGGLRRRDARPRRLSLVGLALVGRRQRLGAVNRITPGVRLPDFRETAKGPEGDAGAITVPRVDRVRRLKRSGSLRRSRGNSSLWRSGRSGCARRPRRNDGRIFEQAGRIALRRERRPGRQRGGERDDRTIHVLCAPNAFQEVGAWNRTFFALGMTTPLPHRLEIHSGFSRRGIPPRYCCRPDRARRRHSSQADSPWRCRAAQARITVTRPSLPFCAAM